MSKMLKIFSINGIEPLYQPQINMSTEEIFSVEIVSRLRHPELGILHQDDFMPIFNQTGLQELLYTEKLSLALEEIQKKQSYISISIDAACSLFEQDMSLLTASICHKYGYPPYNITINIINDNLGEISDKIITNLNKMKEIGIILSINALDISILGLNNYIDIPFGLIKIDKPLISDMIKNFKSREIVRSLINIGKTLDLKCIAAGVDNEETWKTLEEMGVFACQGDYINPAVTLEELLQKEKLLFNNLKADEAIAKELKVIIALNDNFISHRLRDYLSAEIKNTQFIISYDLVDLLTYLDKYDIQSIVIDSGKLQELLKLTNIIELGNIDKIISLNNEIDGNKYDVEQDSVIYLDYKNTLNATAKKIADILTASIDNSINLSILSHQEKIVIEYLMQGKTNKFISSKMMLSEKTISCYKKRALTKLNVNTIVELCKHLS